MATALEQLEQYESEGIVEVNAPMSIPETYPEDDIDDMSAN